MHACAQCDYGENNMLTKPFFGDVVAILTDKRKHININRVATTNTEATRSNLGNINKHIANPVARLAEYAHVVAVNVVYI